MVVVRLARCGARHRPRYRIVVADQRRSARGRYIEVLGYYNPLLKKSEQSDGAPSQDSQSLGLQVDRSRFEAWLARGAQATRRLRSLMREPSESKPTS